MRRRTGAGFGFWAFIVVALFFVWLLSVLDQGGLSPAGWIVIIATGTTLLALVIGPRRSWRILRFVVRRVRRGGALLRRGPSLGEIAALDDYAFEVFCERLLHAHGFRARVTQRSHDEGVDVELDDRKRGRGLAQCKRYAGTVGRPVVQQLYGQMQHAQARYGYVITTGTFSREAVLWAHGKNITLVDGRLVVEMAARVGPL